MSLGVCLFASKLPRRTQKNSEAFLTKRMAEQPSLSREADHANELISPNWSVISDSNFEVITNKLLGERISNKQATRNSPSC